VKRFLATVIKPTMVGLVHTLRACFDWPTKFSWYGLCNGASKSK